MSVLAGGGVNVHPPHRNPRQQLVQLFLHLLGACAEVANVLAAALRAGVGHILHIAAIVAVKFPVTAADVIGHGHITVRALDDMAAAPAADKGIVPPPVHQQHGLFPTLHAGFQRFLQSGGKHGSVAHFQLLAHVGQVHLRHGSAAHPVGHFQQGVIPSSCHGKG